MAMADTARLIASLELQDKFSAGVASATRSLGGLEGRLGKIGHHAQRGISNAAANIMRLGKIVAGVGVGIGVASVKVAMDFEAAMSESLAIMGDVDAEMREKMERTARDVAKTTTFSANQAAEAYFFLASAGMDAEQSIAAMPQVAKFAQAGMFDMAKATDLLTDAQSALGLKSDDAAENLENLTRVSDVLVKANTLANASVEQFSEALTNKAAAALKTLNKDVEEGVAVLAAFADQGVKGQVAGDALARILRDLQTANIKNREAWEGHGIAVYDAEGQMRNMGEIVGDLEGLLEGMSDEQKKITLAQLGFTDRSQAYILALLGSSEAIKDYEAQLREAGGTTDEVANKQLQNFRSQLGLLKSRVIDVGITIGKALLPGLTNIATKLGEVIDKNEPKIEAFGKRLASWFDDASAAAVEFLDTLDFDRLWRDAEGKGEGFLSTLRDLAKELLPAAASAFKAVPWDAVKESMKVMGEAVRTALQMFNSAPDWVKTAVITGWGLNKLTGGAFGAIVGELGKGLIKGVLGMNAGVVNINAGVVNGVPGGVPGGAAGAAPAVGGAAAVGGLATTVGGAAVVGAVGGTAIVMGVAELDKVIQRSQGRGEEEINLRQMISSMEASIETGMKRGLRGELLERRQEELAVLKAQLAALTDGIPVDLSQQSAQQFAHHLRENAERIDTSLVSHAHTLRENADTNTTSLVQQLDRNNDGVVTTKEVLAAELGVSIGVLRGISNQEEKVAERLGISVDELRLIKEKAAATAERINTLNEQTVGLRTKSDEQIGELARIGNLHATGNTILDRKNFSPTINVRTDFNVSARTIVRATDTWRGTTMTAGR